MGKLSEETVQDIWDYHNLSILQSPVVGDESLNRILAMISDVHGENWIEE
jgi:hypothetical protein